MIQKTKDKPLQFDANLEKIIIRTFEKRSKNIESAVLYIPQIMYIHCCERAVLYIPVFFFYFFARKFVLTYIYRKTMCISMGGRAYEKNQ
jgi:hypothetical protein